MTAPQTLKVYFQEHCPALNTTVIMTEGAWLHHILHPQTGHPYMAHKVPLIRQAIKSFQHKGSFFRFSGDPPDSWFADFECPDFKPMHDCLRIAFKRLGDGTVIIASSYKIKRGVMSYEP